MKKIWIIGKKVLLDNLGIVKTLSYLFFMIISSVLIFCLSSEQRASLLYWQGASVGVFFLLGFFWIVGVPFLLYIGSIAIGLISKEINEGTIMLIFTRPVKRSEFLIGKFLGVFFYGIFLNAFLLFFIPSLSAIFLKFDSAFLFELYKVAFALFIYSIFLTLFISSIGILLSSKFENNIISMAILFVIILVTYFLPFMVRSIYKQIFLPDLALLLGAMASSFFDGFGAKMLPLFKSEFFSKMTGIYSSIGGVSFLYEIIEPIKVVNIPLAVSVFITIVLALCLGFLALYILNKKEIY
jgi:ABC-type transport system involved in multi-copper enzyme maturation permease subunit